jgi:hypothetical protein
MGIFNLFRKKEQENKIIEEKKQEPIVTSFEVKYEFVMKNNKSHREDLFKECSEKKTGNDESERECKVCKKLLDVDRYWSRAGIEDLSLKLGYSVYDNPGNGIDKNGYPICACKWVRSTVIKKNKTD